MQVLAWCHYKNYIWKRETEWLHILPQFDRYWCCKNKDMNLEDDDEEGSELIKHLNEKVPEQSQVRCQVANHKAAGWDGLVLVLSRSDNTRIVRSRP